MWDTKSNECLLVRLARDYAQGLVTYTTVFPESASPPEVK